jgi:hypothetical protein
VLSLRCDMLCNTVEKSRKKTAINTPITSRTTYQAK